MLVICEDCAKKYTIDERRIKAARAKFSCRACGHIILVEKPKTVPPPSNGKSAASDNGKSNIGNSNKEDEQKQGRKTKSNDSSTGSAAVKGWTKPIASYLLLTMLVGFSVVSGSFICLYFRYIGEIAEQQIELRSQVITVSLLEAVKVPLEQHDYTLVNQEIKQTGNLPGVAYAAVMNEKGVVVAGSFNSFDGFDSRFVKKVQSKGFPNDIQAKNGLMDGEKERGVRINVGGLPVFDRVMAVPRKYGEVHVGIHLLKTDEKIRSALFSPLFFVPAGLALLFCYLTLFIVDWTITRPMRILINIGNRISLGELDLAVAPDGSREIHDLGTTLTRMRHSIKIAMEKITKNQRR